MTKSKLFILAGNAGYFNRGSEAIIRGTVEILRAHFENPQFVVVSHFKKSEQFVHQMHHEIDASIIHKRMKQAPKRFQPLWFASLATRILFPAGIKHYIYSDLKKYLKDATAVLAVGGDNYSLDYGNSCKICTDLDELVINRGKPHIIWGASVGPFDKNPPFENFMSRHLRKVNIFARETATIEYLDSIGVRDKVFRVADPAFIMNANKPKEHMLDSPIDQGAIGINLSPLMARFVTEGNIKKWTKFATDIVKNIALQTGKRVYLVPHVMAEKTNNDFLFLNEILFSLPNLTKQITVIPPIFSASELKWIISQMRVFVGARTHSTIASLSSHVPTLSLGYSMKSRGINKDIFDHTHYCIDSNILTTELVTDRINDVIIDSDKIRSQLEKRIPEVQKLAMKAGELLKKIS